MNTTPTHIPAGKYVTKAQAAELRGVSTITVQKWIEKGQLPTIQLEGLGHLISYEKLMGFEPARGGRPKSKKPTLVIGGMPKDRSLEAYKRMINGVFSAIVGDAGKDDEVTEAEWRKRHAKFWKRIDENQQKASPK